MSFMTVTLRAPVILGEILTPCTKAHYTYKQLTEWSECSHATVFHMLSSSYGGSGDPRAGSQGPDYSSTILQILLIYALLE